MKLAPMLVLTAACAGDGDKTETPPGADTSWPADSSAAGIAAFLDAGTWREAPWVAETDAPREPTSQVSPHDRVQVWLNDVLVESQEAGNGAFGGSAHPVGSMAIKEMFDEADAPDGVAVMLKLEGDAAEWVYYCDGPDLRCGVSPPTDPSWGVGSASECSFCHGGLVFNTL